ncbi:DUF2735 domain-containing protein [Rhizobium skierniewicense]|uniref:DUF2735 domain-containing protein n=1 Tax=Rhizobium skierniewicense TaxID=984260 RepID=UPI0015726FB6|nr:DUF2735 domain-containing protein [Rhizobium skierniewicense]NTF32726.1 DUF2735 domain-containing protein [Rhizobium skierniewicense]
MRSDPQMESATIYQFPVGGRAGFKGLRKESILHGPTAAAPKTHIDFDSWYHQEAIQKNSDLGKPHN